MTLQKLFIFLIFFLSIPITTQARFEARVLNLGSGVMVANDVFIGKESINLIVRERLEGSGLLQAPEITITVGVFDFTGTIHCDGVCHITAQEPFDDQMFKREGKGQFIITIKPVP